MAIQRIPRDIKPREIAVVQYPGNGILGGLAQVTRTPLPTGEVVQGLNILVTGVCDIVAVDGLGLSPEHPLPLIRDIQIVASSRSRPEIGEIKRSDAAAAYQLAHYFRGTPGLVLPMADAVVQAATPFAFDIDLPFELQHALNPAMTLLNSQELASFDLIIQWEDATGLIIPDVGTETTITLCQVRVTAREYTDTLTKAARYGINRFRTLDIPIPAANAGQRIDVKGGYYLRGLLIKQFTQAAGENYHTPVATILNGLEFQLNRNPKVRYPFLAQLDADNKVVYSMELLPVGYTMLDFMREKRPDSLIDSRTVDSLELVADVNFVADGRLRVYPIEVIPVTGRR